MWYVTVYNPYRFEWTVMCHGSNRKVLERYCRLLRTAGKRAYMGYKQV